MTIRGLRGTGFFVPTDDTPVGVPTGFFKAISQFQLDRAAESETETGWPAASSDFRQQALRVVEQSITWTLQVTFKDLDWELIQLLMGQFDQVTASYPEDESFSGVVPGSGALEFTDTNLITDAATIGNTKITVGERGPWGEVGPLTVVDTVPADSREVQLDNTTGKLVFHADAVNMPFFGMTVVNRANINTVGFDANALSLDTLGFTGILDTDSTKTPEGIRMKVPRMQSDGNISFTMGDTIPEVQMTFTLSQEVGQNNVLHFARRLAAA